MYHAPFPNVLIHGRSRTVSLRLSKREINRVALQRRQTNLKFVGLGPPPPSPPAFPKPTTTRWHSYYFLHYYASLLCFVLYKFLDYNFAFLKVHTKLVGYVVVDTNKLDIANNNRSSNNKHNIDNINSESCFSNIKAASLIRPSNEFVKYCFPHGKHGRRTQLHILLIHCLNSAFLTSRPPSSLLHFIYQPPFSCTGFV